MKRPDRSAIALLALLLAAPAAAKKPLNWRMRKKPPVAVSTETASGVDASTAPAPGPAPLKLMAGRWTPEVRGVIERTIVERGKTAAGYDPKVPPVAILPWSDAAVSGDPAELVFLRLVTEVKFKIDDDWWGLIPIGYGRQPIRAAYDQFVAASSSVWTDQPSYHAWRKGMIASYLALCRGVGRKECRSYLSRLWAGWREEAAQDYARETLAAEKTRAASFESVSGEPGDRAPLRVRRGLRVVPEMRDLVAKLRDSGFDVWVVDDVPQPVLAASTTDYGVDPSRNYGVRGSSEGVRMGADVLKPVPTRGGKTEAVQAMLGRPPDLAFGRDSADYDLLSYGDGARVVFDRDPELVRKAREKGWAVQPALAR